MINPVHLETVRTVLREGSLSGAARALGYTTSAVSQQVAALEKSLGVTLFERRPHQLVPTAAAVRMGEHADDLLRRMLEVENDMGLFVGGGRGRLRVRSFPSAATHLVPPVLARFAADRPQVDIELEVHTGSDAEIVSTVVDCEADLALTCVYGMVPSPPPLSLSVRRVLEERLVLLLPAGHPLSGTTPIDLAELRDQAWIANTDGSAAATNLERLAATAGFKPRIRFRTDDYDVVRGVIRTGVAVALVPALALGNDRTMTMRPVADDQAHRTVLAVSRRDDPNPLVNEAHAAVQDAVDAFTSWTETAFASELGDVALARRPGAGQPDPETEPDQPAAS